MPFASPTIVNNFAGRDASGVNNFSLLTLADFLIQSNFHAPAGHVSSTSLDPLLSEYEYEQGDRPAGRDLILNDSSGVVRNFCMMTIL